MCILHIYGVFWCITHVIHTPVINVYNTCNACFTHVIQVYSLHITCVEIADTCNTHVRDTTYV